MKCPVCGAEMKTVEVGGIRVDVCYDCGAIWFDDDELSKFDEVTEPAGEILASIKPRKKVKVDPNAKRICPRCGDIVLMRHYFSVAQKVEIDECPKCGGILLDAGELAQIRSTFPTEEERRKATEQFIRRHFDPQLQKMAQESREKLSRARRFARALRFLCPSYYIKGDQDWGAF